MPAADCKRNSHHVIQDFEPYFCIFETCDAPFDVPNTFQGLLSHMHGHVPEKWHIETPEGHKEFEDEQDFERYVRDRGDIPESLLPTMMEFSRRRGALFFDHCAFCGGYPDAIEKDFADPSMLGAQEKMRKHIKQHLHDIALFLPPDHDNPVENENNDAADSDCAGQARSEEIWGGSEAATRCGRDSCDCRPEEKPEWDRQLSDDPIWQPSTPTDDTKVRTRKGDDSDFWRDLFAGSLLDVIQAEASYDPRADKTLVAFVARSNPKVGQEEPLWDRAYDALRESDWQLAEEYEKLLSRELQIIGMCSLRAA